MRTEPCAVFPVKSGWPVIGLGILLICIPIITMIIGPSTALPLPISLLFIGFGLFLIWLGITK